MGEVGEVGEAEVGEVVVGAEGADEERRVCERGGRERRVRGGWGAVDPACCRGLLRRLVRV